MSIQKILSVFAFVLLSIQSVLAEEGNPFLLVSDIDDTVKITHVSNCAAALENCVHGKDVFAGMKELYQEWATHSKAIVPGKLLVYLSGGPKSIRNTVHDLLV